MHNRTEHNPALWTRLGQHDPTALDELFSSYAPSLFQYGMSICPHREQVKDALQDVFLNVWERRSQLPDIQNGERYLAIYLERRLELAMEAHRWFDLIRTDRFLEVMAAHTENGGTLVSPNNVLMPIPQREIDANPNLTQNPGY